MVGDNAGNPNFVCFGYVFPTGAYGGGGGGVAVYFTS